MTCNPRGSPLTTDVPMQLEGAKRQQCFYVGESDNVRARLAVHRKAMPRKHHARVLAALIAGLPRQEKSSARLVEKQLQQALLQMVRRRYGQRTGPSNRASYRPVAKRVW